LTDDYIHISFVKSVVNLRNDAGQFTGKIMSHEQAFEGVSSEAYQIRRYKVVLMPTEFIDYCIQCDYLPVESDYLPLIKSSLGHELYIGQSMSSKVFIHPTPVTSNRVYLNTLILRDWSYQSEINSGRLSEID